MSASRVRVVLFAFAALAALVAGHAASRGDVVNGSHPEGFHLDSIHLAYDDEDFCVNSTGTFQPSRWSDANNNAIYALWGNSNSAEEWDAKAWDLGGPAWRIWFVSYSDACQNLSSTVRGPIEIEYWIEDDTRTSVDGWQPWYCPSWAAYDTSCAFADGAYFSAAGHYNYEFYYVFLYKPYAVGDINPDGAPNFAYHQINHETGHVLGFRDGSGSTDCPDSVMHSRAYGCSTNRRYPSTADTNAETSIAFGH